MIREAQLAGVTPYVLRLAAYYAAMGIGSYYPKGYSHFDVVTVRQLMPWHPGEHFTDSMMVLIVEFFRGDHRERYVEFSLMPAGFGGEPIMKLLPSQEVTTHKKPSRKDDHPSSDKPPGAGT